MFDITELDGLVCQHLSNYDLAQCAQVNKKWHTIIVPYLWEDLTRQRMKTKALCKLILEDYLHERQHQLAQEGDLDMEQYSQASSKVTLPSLTKYCKWVLWLPDPGELLGELVYMINQQLALPGHNVDATVHESILHLYIRCPAFKVRRLILHHQHSELSGLQMTIMKYVMPRVQELYVYSSLRDQHYDFRGLAELMDRCSGTLERVVVNVMFTSSSIDTTRRIDDHKAHEPTTGPTSLKEVILLTQGNGSDPKVFWTWLFKWCHYTKKLAVYEFNGSIQSAVECMLEHMPYLDELMVYPTSNGMSDSDVATLLAGSSKGWKIVELYSPATLEESAMRALLKHSSTLESLYVGNGVDVTSNDLVQVLVSCPNLRCLNDAPGKDSTEDSRLIHANVFIDRDQDTGMLRTWACEAFLKDLKIKIMGIPRPDQKDVGAEKETYPGQGREIQGQVYDRLARLTNLETLWLQGDAFYNSHHGYLEMSLESGLHRLKGLKMLKELDVSQTKARIGVQEVQWMTEHWPQLRVISGLCSEENEEVIAWLAENHPVIEIKP
jgi:hypothetical protein